MTIYKKIREYESSMSLLCFTILLFDSVDIYFALQNMLP